MVAVEQDHPRARSEDRGPETPDRVFDAVEAHQSGDRCRLAARDDQPVEPVELVRLPHLDGLSAEAAQNGRVLTEVPLHCQDADPHAAILVFGAIDVPRFPV
jgi:hypothetical protein